MDQKIIARNLQIYLKELHITKEELSNATGEHPKTIEQFITGAKEPSRSQLLRMQCVLGNAAKMYVHLLDENETADSIHEKINRKHEKCCDRDSHVLESDYEEISAKHKEIIHKGFKRAVKENRDTVYELFRENIVKEEMEYFLYRIENDYYLIKGCRTPYSIYAKSNECTYLGREERDVIKIADAIDGGIQMEKGELMRRYNALVHTNRNPSEITILREFLSGKRITRAEYVEMLEA